MTRMTMDEWAGLSARIVAWWPATRWTPETFAIWYEDLQHHEYAAVKRALAELRQQPGAFGPSIGDLLSRLRSDPAAPTFEEFCALVFGPAGLLSLKPPPRGLWREGERAEATRALVNARLEELHPLVGAFVARIGLSKLRVLPVEASSFVGDSGSWESEAKWALRDLREAWDRHVEASDGREVATVAAGSGRDGLRQLDPLAALGVGARAELPAPS